MLVGLRVFPRLDEAHGWPNALTGTRIMSEPRIVLAGMGPKLSGLTWESNKFLRIGRQTNLDVVLRDHSVERIHAEIRHQGMRWILRDLAHNPMYPTLVNN